MYINAALAPSCCLFIADSSIGFKNLVNAVCPNNEFFQSSPSGAISLANFGFLALVL
jgi:hypothetical protein